MTFRVKVSLASSPLLDARISHQPTSILSHRGSAYIHRIHFTRPLSLRRHLRTDLARLAPSSPAGFLLSHRFPGLILLVIGGRYEIPLIHTIVISI
jgi:hypothetical protein